MLTTWIPTEHNPSKLRQHRWDGERWEPLAFCRFVPCGKHFKRYDGYSGPNQPDALWTAFEEREAKLSYDARYLHGELMESFRL